MLALAALAALAVAAASVAGPAPGAKNFLLIAIDDLRPSTEALQQPSRRMRMAASAIFFLAPFFVFYFFPLLPRRRFSSSSLLCVGLSLLLRQESPLFVINQLAGLT